MVVQDLPVPPAGFEWQQHKPDVCLLYRGKTLLGKVAVEKGESVYSRVGGPRCSLDTVDHRFAAMDLFGQLGLEVAE